MSQPDKPVQRVVLVTGPSGAGRSTAIHALEDLGHEAIDNLPLSLVPRLLDGEALGRPVALGIDVRNRDFSATALIEAPDGPRDDLRAYFCGASAWGKVTFYLDGLARQANRPTAATYATTSAGAPVQDPDGRWRLREIESWTYTLSNGGTRVSNEEYLYWLVATPNGAPGGAPPFCIDDYAFQRAR